MAKYDYEVHPATEVFPMMTDAEYIEFKEDVARNGLREPIMLWKGVLIDGRNRLKVCKDLKKPPPVATLASDEDPVAHILSVNLHRRHLTVGQRAICAAKLAKLQAGDNQHVQGEVSPKGETSLSDAATMFGVGERSVSRAREVLRDGSTELVKAVEEGEIKVTAAAELTEKVPDKREQNKLLRRGPDAVRAVLKKRPRPDPGPDFGDTDHEDRKAPKPPPKLPTRSKLLDKYHEVMDSLWEEATQGEQFAMRADLNSRETK